MGIGKVIVNQFVFFEIDDMDKIEVKVTDDEAIDMARKLMLLEGISCGISSGAAMSACLKIAARPEAAGKTIVTVLPDSGERYLSTSLFDRESLG